MEVRWAPRAADDLEAIVRYIQQDDPEAAHRVAQTIDARAEGLQTCRIGAGPDGSKEHAS